jgi:hypothetical protein
MKDNIIKPLQWGHVGCVVIETSRRSDTSWRGSHLQPPCVHVRMSQAGTFHLYPALAYMKSVLKDVQYWRDCAEEARALAATVYFDSTRQQMLAIAESYEGLAKQAEACTKSKQPKDM